MCVQICVCLEDMSVRVTYLFLGLALVCVCVCVRKERCVCALAMRLSPCLSVCVSVCREGGLCGGGSRQHDHCKDSHPTLQDQEQERGHTLKKVLSGITFTVATTTTMTTTTTTGSTLMVARLTDYEREGKG